MNNVSPRIVCAAIKMKDGFIAVGIRHLSPDMREMLRRIYGDEYYRQTETQGFVDQFGKFYTREEAWKLADFNGQIFRETGLETTGYYRTPKIGDKGLLFSENLY